jgi:hypothetical protein
VTGIIRNKLNNLGRRDMPLSLTEWGPYSIDATMNYAHTGAAWAAAFLPEAVADGISMGSYLILSDATGGAAEGNLLQQSLTHKPTDANNVVHYFPKPVTNVFKMFTIMTGVRNAVTVSPTNGSTTSNLNAFATSDGNSASILVYNYNSSIFNNNGGSLVDSPENFIVSINLGQLWSDPDSSPFTGNVTVKRYLVDATHSNLYAFLNDPSHPSPELQMLDPDPLPGTITNGQWTSSLAGTPLGLGAMLFRIEKSP